MKSKVTRAGKAAKTIQLLHERIGAKWEKAGDRIAERVLIESQILAPKDTHALVASGHKFREGGGVNSVFIVGYGRLSFDAGPYGPDRMRRPPFYYAMVVHETHSTNSNFLLGAVRVTWGDLKTIAVKEMKK